MKPKILPHNKNQNMKNTKKIISGAVLAMTLFSNSIALAAGVKQWPSVSSSSPIDMNMSGSYESRGVRTSDGKTIIAMTDGSQIGVQELNDSGTAQWNSGSPVIISGSTGEIIEGVADSSGGAFILHSGTPVGSRKYYVSHVDSTGTINWTSGPFDNTNTTDYWPRILHDGSGGVYVTWYTKPGTNHEVHMTHINSSGTVPSGWNTGGSGTYRQLDWTNAGGAPVDSQVPDPKLVLSDSGNVIFAFTSSGNIHFEKLSPTGSTIWTKDAPDANYEFMAEPDGNNGVFAAYWNANLPYQTLRVLELDSSGTVKVGRYGRGGALIGGLGIEDIDGALTVPDGMVSTHDGDYFYIAWNEQEVSTGEDDVYVRGFQRGVATASKKNAGLFNQGKQPVGVSLATDMTELWAGHKVLISTLGDNIFSFIDNIYLTNIQHQIIPSGTNSVMVAMNYSTMSSPWKSYIVVQKINDDGTLDYGFNGGLVVTNNITTDYDQMPDLVSDGSEGGIVSWFQNGTKVVAQYVKKSTPKPVFCGYTQTSGAFDTTYGLRADGTVWAWGSNALDELGNGVSGSALTKTNVPVQVSGLTNVKTISAGGNHGLAIKNDGTLWAWGYNLKGQLGDGTTSNSNVPLQVKGPGGSGYLTNVVAASGGDLFSVAIKDDGTVWAWGDNGNGELGDGTPTDRPYPVQVIDPSDSSGYLTGVTDISAGEWHTAAIKRDSTGFGYVYTWGLDASGELGDNKGAYPFSTTPIDITSNGYLPNISTYAVDAHLGFHTLVLLSDTTMYAWGDNAYGQIGDGSNTERDLPVQVSNMDNVSSISASSASTYIKKNDNTNWAWGDNSGFQLGDGTTNNSNVPIQVTNITNAVYVSQGGTRSVQALKNDGSLWAWGNNILGTLGDGTYTTTSSAVLVDEGACVAPITGTDAGGTSVDISGNNFVSGATVSFGGTSGTVNIVSDTGINVSTPAHAAGAVNVVVTNPDAQFATLTNGFTYTSSGGGGGCGGGGVGGTQQGCVNITCPSGSTPASLVRIPANVFFSSVLSPTSGTNSTVDSDAGDFTSTGAFPGGNTSTAGISGTSITNDHLLRVQDQSSQGVEGCGGDNDNWAVTATMTSFHDPNGTHIAALTKTGDTDYVNANTIKIITTNKVNTDNVDNGGPAKTGSVGGVFYDDYTSTGSSHSVNALCQANGTDLSVSGVAGGTYTPPSLCGTVTNTLNNTVPILRHCRTAGQTSENADVYAGVAIAIDNGIHTLQETGNYTGTIEYTFQSGAGAGCV